MFIFDNITLLTGLEKKIMLRAIENSNVMRNLWFLLLRIKTFNFYVCSYLYIVKSLLGYGVFRSENLTLFFSYWNNKKKNLFRTILCISFHAIRFSFWLSIFYLFRFTLWFVYWYILIFVYLFLFPVRFQISTVFRQV